MTIYTEEVAGICWLVELTIIALKVVPRRANEYKVCQERIQRRPIVK